MSGYVKKEAHARPWYKPGHVKSMWRGGMCSGENTGFSSRIERRWPGRCGEIQVTKAEEGEECDTLKVEGSLELTMR